MLLKNKKIATVENCRKILRRGFFSFSIVFDIYFPFHNLTKIRKEKRTERERSLNMLEYPRCFTAIPERVGPIENPRSVEAVKIPRAFPFESFFTISTAM